MRNRNTSTITVGSRTYIKEYSTRKANTRTILVSEDFSIKKSTVTRDTKKALLAFDIFSREDISKEAKKPLFKNVNKIITN